MAELLKDEGEHSSEALPPGGIPILSKHGYKEPIRGHVARLTSPVSYASTPRSSLRVQAPTRQLAKDGGETSTAQ